MVTTINFRIGDIVRDSKTNEIGRVIIIDNLMYPIGVLFETGDTHDYTLNGHYYLQHDGGKRRITIIKLADEL
jgi:hypothetical protein